jgi:molecular chaperone HscA
MAGGLYDIAEPGASSVKEACKGRAVGIDLGTTNSLVAVIRDANPVCLRDESGALLPSVVRYRADGPPIVGVQARATAAEYPQDTMVSIKRFMGRAPAEADRRSGYRFVDGGPVVKIAVAGGREITPIEVSAEILRTLRLRAEEQLGGPLEGAVITVPAYFDDAQRQATKDAGRIAGLDVMRLINEPTAAALAYGLDKKKNGLFAVFDLGGGTFDISILKLADGVFEVKSTAGDTALGGDDFDHALADILAARRGVAVSRGLLDEARALKHALTSAESAGDIARAEFEAAIAPIVARTGAICKRALSDAGIKLSQPSPSPRGARKGEPPQLDGVILVGGATRVPAVRQFVEKLFGQPPLTDLDPDQVVALGAAVQADVLAGERTDVLLLDVIPLSLGLELMGGIVEKIIHRNSTVPAGARQTFTTYADKQTGFDLHVVQGERETADQCRSLARFQLKGIPPMAAGMARLEVTFLVDADGILAVTAREETTGKEAHVSVKPSYGLSEDDIEAMLVASYENAEEDLAARVLAEARVEAERILQALDGALSADGTLLDASERGSLDSAAAALRATLPGKDARAIRDATTALDVASKLFAERRMNRDMGAALGGRDVGLVEKEVEHARGTADHEAPSRH